MEKIVQQDEKVVFFKLQSDGNHSVSNDYRVVGESKTGGLIVVRNYRKDYYNQKRFWIKSDLLNTTSEYWQLSKNKPKYFVRVLPLEFTY